MVVSTDRSTGDARPAINGDTMDDEPIIVPVERTGRAPLLRIGLVGAAAAALVAVGILAAAASAAPGGILAADPSASPSASAGATTNHPGGPGWAFGGRGGGMPGDGMRSAGITVTAISGSSVSLTTADGWTRTITVDSGTTYQKAGATAALTDLKVGDEIQFKETRETNGTFTIDAISVIPPHAGGTVSAISGSTITVTLPDGSSATIKVTSTTTYDVGGNASAKLSDIKTGFAVMATGTRNSDGSLSATSVRAFDPAAMPAHGDRGFGHGFPGGPGRPGTDPNASAAPSATSGATNG
jgi:hypothetical protein